MVFPDGEWKIVDGVVTEGNGGFIDLLFESPLAAIGVILLLGVIIIPIFILWFICWCIYKLVQLLVNSYRESKSIKGTSIVYPRLTHPANNNVVSLTPIVDTVESKPVSVVSKTSTTKQYYSKWDQAMDNITVPIEAPKSETVLQTQVSTVPRKEQTVRKPLFDKDPSWRPNIVKTGDQIFDSLNSDLAMIESWNNPS